MNTVPRALRAPFRHSLRRSIRQRGVVLLITLVLIVVMSLLGTFAIRNATQSERSINGVRSAEVAREAAETALRFCEQVAMSDAADKDYTEFSSTGMRERIIASPAVASEADTSAAWRSAGSWKGTNVIEVPESYFRKTGISTGDLSQLKEAPRCLIQKIASTAMPALTGYLITARGFANDANFNADTGKSTQGAEAWMQSVLTPGT
ncbi:PilX N-terminal domain-containing pilus assembly protein [Variovorax sp. H27-G14]|uniref:pilus assembly PilX family protein n=1 Tax=Variovorax sp. H27-G14 TaxID=3111914 RepID=UPI0038FBFAB8